MNIQNYLNRNYVNYLKIPFATISRIEDEFNLASAYVYEGGAKSKQSIKSKNTKNTEETVNNDTSICSII